MNVTTTCGDLTITVIPAYTAPSGICMSYVNARDSLQGRSFTACMRSDIAAAMAAYFIAGADDETHPQHEDAYIAWSIFEAVILGSDESDEEQRALIETLRFVP